MNVPATDASGSALECSGALDFCNLAVLNAGSVYVPFRYTYFEDYLVVLSRANISNAQILKVEGPMYEQRKRFSKGIGKGRTVCIKVFPLLLCSSPLCMKFVLYHEIGHIRNGDINIKDYVAKRKESLLSGTVMLSEQLADMHAAKKIGKAGALKALQEMNKRKSRALANLSKFGEHHMNKIKESPVLLSNYNSELSNLKLSVMELDLRLEHLERLNIK